MKILGRYKNGNVDVSIFDNGTKIRRTEENIFKPLFSESCDVKITNKCDGGCQYCYEGCTPLGKHGDILNKELIDSLRPYTELAINGNDLTHPDLNVFLKILKDKKVIVNMTVNQKHFIKKIDYIDFLINNNLIKGLGVSLVTPDDDFINIVKQYKNSVIHVINGIVTVEQLKKLSENNLKILILGYKYIKKGISYANDNNDKILENCAELKNYIHTIIKNKNNEFNVISFDNLALEQLDIQSCLSEKEWETFYMGDDGTFTFYIDLVDKTFAKNSVIHEIQRFTLLDNIDDMFKVIQMLNA